MLTRAVTANMPELSCDDVVKVAGAGADKGMQLRAARFSDDVLENSFVFSFFAVQHRPYNTTPTALGVFVGPECVKYNRALLIQPQESQECADVYALCLCLDIASNFLSRTSLNSRLVIQTNSTYVWDSMVRRSRHWSAEAVFPGGPTRRLVDEKGLDVEHGDL